GGRVGEEGRFRKSGRASPRRKFVVQRFFRGEPQRVVTRCGRDAPERRRGTDQGGGRGRPFDRSGDAVIDGVDAGVEHRGVGTGEKAEAGDDITPGRGHVVDRLDEGAVVGA